MNHDTVRSNLGEKPLTNTVLAAVLVEVGNEVLLLPLKLHTERDDNIEPLKAGRKLIEDLNLFLPERPTSEVLGHQGVWTDQANLVTKREVRPHTTAGDP